MYVCIQFIFIFIVDTTDSLHLHFIYNNEKETILIYTRIFALLFPVIILHVSNFLLIFYLS